MATTHATEAERMARVPGVIFVDSAAGRRARVAGSGIEVFEVIDVWRGCNGDRAALAPTSLSRHETGITITPCAASPP